MITIQNVGPFDQRDPLGERDYALAINGKVLAEFKHRRGDGLAKCLELASKAVAGRQVEMEREIKNLFGKKKGRKT